MVRAFPARHPFTPHGWQGHSQGYQQPTMGIRGAKFQTSNRGTAAFPLVCVRTKEPHSFGIFYGHNPLMFSFNVILVGLILINLITRTFRFLLKPLRQPRLVSELIAGIIIGPSLLGQSKSFTNIVFPLNAKFVLRNVGVMGFMLFVFVSGVKMDLGMLKRSGKKHLFIALISVFGPLIIVIIVAWCNRKSMDKELGRLSSIGTIASSLSITGFPIHYAVLQELNLLSSEVGSMALSIALISDSIGMNFLVAFQAMKQGEVSNEDALWYIISLVVLLAFLVTAFRRAMLWIIEKTPVGEPVDQLYVVAILLGVFVTGFLTDMFGIAIANGPFWLGLVIPNGPPLGATLVERSETIMMEIIMPCSFAFVGLNTDFSEMTEAGWSSLGPLFALFISGYLSKFLSTLIGAKMVDVPWRDSLALSLVLSLRGQVELILYVHWVDKNIIRIPSFSMLIFLTTVLTGILTPLISILYDPTKPYMVNKRRTIQHTAPGEELKILLCIQDKINVPSLVNLLEVSYPTVDNPFSVYAFHLVELIGRANPLFIDHQNQEVEDLFSRFPDSETIHNALKLYHQRRDECVELHFFTALTAKRTMYQDVCKLALISKATIIILPLEKECDGEIVTKHWGSGHRSLTTEVLAHAPCSVGILIDKADRWHLPLSRSFGGATHSFIVLFLGGPDSREALAYADRMVGNPSVSLTVIRFLSSNSEGDDEMQKKLDDGLVTWFWVKNETNERVIYKEVVVRNGEDTASAILAMAEEHYYHLWIVGRKQGINPSLLEGLSTWTENKEELGIIGDYISSSDCVNADSVLVVQKQVLRGQENNNTSRSPSFMRCLFCS
ncbi:cation/H(+) antiporter 24-like [Durio zibethinus]|uniref:Cation/H(+) antiporter 24-like n=1 Tax=Durio zibethinus TaxID=66656 RepID=A0A6P5XKK6_DURZI|nr:cation/H(+) antiporter 24-like [Durio zibethinus]